MTDLTTDSRSSATAAVHDFQHLMAKRVENIILVSSTYDTFILQEDGQLSELILGEFLDSTCTTPPGLTHVPRAEAIALAPAESGSTSSSPRSTWATWTRPNWPAGSRRPGWTSR